MAIKEIVAKQTEYFRKGTTRDIAFRQQMLTKLEESILAHEEELYEAMQIDLGKSKAECYMTELSMVLGELREIRKRIPTWAKPRRVRGTMGGFPSRNVVYSEPYGVVLVLAPWNYPFLLALSPLVGALAAGNCVILKCSKSSLHCAQVIQGIVNEALPPEVCYAVDPKVNYSEILEQQYQYIFFTGSPKVGKEVMSAAADRLIPVSLELGGKSPCFVTKSANVKLAAKRIVWGKLLNAGQTCVAVDYVLVDASRKRELLIAIVKEIQKRYGDPLENPDYPRIISQYHYDRLMGLIALEEMRGPIMGGEGDPVTRKIEPCIIPNADWTHTVMREELFGPILPVVAYDNLDEAMEEVLQRPHPLATYIFSEDKEEVKTMLARMPFGGGCVNDVVMHITNHHMPFGGVGNSGMGGYHGRDSFKTFSHEKSVFYGSHVDVPVRYAPLDEKKWNLLKKLMK